ARHGWSYEQRRVAVRIETVAGGDRVRVGAQDEITASEREGQREQRRPRQVEVREEHAHDAEAMTRVDRGLHASIELGERSGPGRYALERPRRCRPDRHDTTALQARLVDGACGFRGH